MMMGEDSIVKVMCIFEVGENTTRKRLMRVCRSINFRDLLVRVKDRCEPAVISTIMYKHPTSESNCDQHVSIIDDEDVFNMMQEFPPGMAPIELYAYAKQSYFQPEPEQNLDNGTIQSTSALDFSSHMIATCSRDDYGSTSSHLQAETYNSLVDNNVALQQTRRNSLENIERNAIPCSAVQKPSLSNYRNEQYCNLQGEDNAMVVDVQPLQEPDNSSYNHTSSHVHYNSQEVADNVAIQQKQRRTSVEDNVINPTYSAVHDSFNGSYRNECHNFHGENSANDTLRYMQYDSQQVANCNVNRQSTPRSAPLDQDNEMDAISHSPVRDSMHVDNCRNESFDHEENHAMPQELDNSSKNKTSKMSFAIFKDQEFRTREALDMAAMELSICDSFTFKTKRTSRNCVVITCAEDKCPWRIEASKVPCGSNFRIKTFESNHHHMIVKQLEKRPKASKKWVINYIRNRARKYLQSTSKEISEDIYHDYKIKVLCNRVWRCMRSALEKDYIGSSICDLAAYCNKIEKTNQGSVVSLGFPLYESLGIFIAYNATIHGFREACRPIITLRSRKIEGDNPHVWLYATGLDAGYNSFMLAYAVVESSDQEMWTWFCGQLALILHDSPGLTIVTVKEENSSEAVGHIFPKACRRYNRKLLYEDFNQKFQCEALSRYFRRAIDATTEDSFHFHMDEISLISLQAQEWINEISPSPEFWAVSYFGGQQDCEDDHLSTEAFDILRDDVDAMNSTVISKLKWFHAEMSKKFLRNQAEQSSDEMLRQLTPYASIFLHNVFIQVEQSSFIVEHHYETLFLAKSVNDKGYLIVDIAKRTCQCHMWQRHKLPCSHALGAILKHGSNVLDYYEDYTVAKRREAYLELIH